MKRLDLAGKKIHKLTVLNYRVLINLILDILYNNEIAFNEDNLYI